MIEYCRLNIEDLMFASLRAVGSALYEPEAGGSTIKKNDKNEKSKPPARRGCSAYASESDIHKYSIFNLQLTSGHFSRAWSRKKQRRAQ